jgi:hypothetical protein
MHLQDLLLPGERVLGWSVFAFTAAEILLAYNAISKLVKKQTVSYSRLVNQDDDEADPLGMDKVLKRVPSSDTPIDPSAQPLLQR